MRPGAVPPALRAALASPGGRCYRHCEEPTRTVRLTSRLPGALSVRVCPGGVVSVTVYAEWAERDPTPSLRTVLEGWTVPRSLVRRWDLRLASRHGPELGRPAERYLAARGRGRPIRVVYWRVYPFRGRDGRERRLFLCVRRGHPGPVFFAGPADATTWGCPVCAGRRRTRPARGR